MTCYTAADNGLHARTGRIFVNPPGCPVPAFWLTLISELVDPGIRVG
jgi:hypothetical protein